jgi:hypothetical protein
MKPTKESLIKPLRISDKKDWKIYLQRLHYQYSKLKILSTKMFIYL